MKTCKGFPAVAALLGGVVALLLVTTMVPALERRNDISYLRGPYNNAFFWRHNDSFRISAALHFSHGKQHDVLMLTPLEQRTAADERFDGESVRMLKAPPRTEPDMEYYSPYAARTIWQLFRAIDWTHMHHEQTYDILADRRIPWSEKKPWTDRAVRYYLGQHDIPRSPAPLDVTMRRAGVMMKPYFTVFRNLYPRSNNFFYAAHWWHPVIYEAMMLGGNGPDQERMVRETDETMHREVILQRPQRMLLSRELKPKYSRLSPESANIFDNLHMLHGIAYDILAYEGWTLEQKRDELYRVIRAMAYQPGDEKLSRKFSIDRPDVDPRVYYDWMKGSEGAMNRIMMEMMEEMMPGMMPGMARGGMHADMRERMVAQMKLKLAPGMQQGERPGSLMEALKGMMPEMQMAPEAMAPGGTPKQMIDMMLKGWQEKHGNQPDVAPMPMDREPGKPA